MRPLIPALFMATALAALAGCGRPAPDAGPARTLTVAAAADLYNAFTEMGRRFEETTGHKVVFTFGSSTSLAQQIVHGAPVDVYAAADVQLVEDLKARGLVLADTQRLYAIGRIVLAGNRAAGVDPQNLSGLLDPGIRQVVIANPEHAPYGRAARAALVSAGVWEPIQPKLVLAENVRQALQFVQTGNAEAGIIALSLIADIPEITYHEIDPQLYPPLEQSIAVVRGSPNEAAARQFVDFVVGPAGRSILEQYGFGLPGEM